MPLSLKQWKCRLKGTSEIRDLEWGRSTVFVARFTLALLSQSKIFRSAVGGLGARCGLSLT